MMNALGKYSRSNLLGIIVFFIFLLIPLTDTSAEERNETGLFGSDDMLEIVLTTDIKNLLKTKDKGEYQTGEITMEGYTYSIKLKARGNYRRENCFLPPITLNFSDTQFEDKSYEQLNKIKLVNVCKMQSSYEQYILEEYLIYRLLNLLSDKSFKVRLLKIDYVDSKEKVKTSTRYGFVIEDQYMLAERLDGIIIKKEGIRAKAVNTKQMILISIFQFMIGNTDWSVPRLHNLKLLKINKVTEPDPYAIPYDFDYTGMVNASYAVPSQILGIETLRERVFWGPCFTQAQLAESIEYFIQKKEAVYNLYNEFPLLDKRNLNESISFLDSFYQIIENERLWKYSFIDNCKE